MEEMKGKKKRLSINLSFLTLSDSRKRANARYSPTHFEGPNGVVGLGILAAMKDDRQPHQDHFFNSGAVLAISPKSASNSIPIIKNKNSSENSSCKKFSAAEMEGCEEYTCVISHVGQNLIKKREYFDAEILGTNDGCAGVLTGNGGGPAAASDGGETAAFAEADFLSSCVLCEKKLHGLDVFMYR